VGCNQTQTPHESAPDACPPYEGFGRGASVSLHECGAWRRYPRAPGATQASEAQRDGAQLLGGLLERQTQRSRAWQLEQRARVGFAATDELARLGHATRDVLIGRGYPALCAHAAGQLAAVSSAFNWIGLPRAARLCWRALRTLQRYRARLEADGLLKSFTLEPGDRLAGMRAPVRRPMTVRDVSRLQELGQRRLRGLAVPPARPPSAAEPPAPPSTYAAGIPRRRVPLEPPATPPPPPRRPVAEPPRHRRLTAEELDELLAQIPAELGGDEPGDGGTGPPRGT